ncbi:hypothetical protein F4821DRAFT_71851 [Hypoxylon rubiginosum]|uniref:Uncharacterized protein n=1 Tax=Hypoxylon rubiginosum TaxID=110542 RepID=A0ACC0CIF8_9PEZI|nr:hypothetical protein F4821DRAFT_71851 [Hypoxylon rubiginosum]
MIVIAVTVSTYSVVVGPDWGNVMMRYAAVGYGAMAGGELGVAVGALSGGALSVVLGSIVGSALGHFGVDYLANSLLGKVPDKRVEELLCSANEQASRWAKNKMIEAKREYVSMGSRESPPKISSAKVHET